MPGEDSEAYRHEPWPAAVDGYGSVRGRHVLPRLDELRIREVCVGSMEKVSSCRALWPRVRSGSPSGYAVLDTSPVRGRRSGVERRDKEPRALTCLDGAVGSDPVRGWKTCLTSRAVSIAYQLPEARGRR